MQNSHSCKSLHLFINFSLFFFKYLSKFFSNIFFLQSALAVFKTPGTLEKQVDSCHIQLDPSSETLSFILKYKNSIIKTHLIPIIDCETIKVSSHPVLTFINIEHI